MMKYAKFLIFLLAGCLASVAYAENFTIDVGQFEKLKINGNISVMYKNLPDSTGIARYSAPAGSPDYFKFTTKGDGSLKVEPSEEFWSSSDLPILFLYSDFLSNIESYSEKDIEIVSLAPCSAFSVNLIGNGSIDVNDLRCNNLSAAITTGNGSIYISGTCVNASYRMVGAGLISADQMRADAVKCRILGTGSIGCWANDNLRVTGLGSTKIYYKGKPHIKKTGGGKLFELPEDLDEKAYEHLGTPVPSLSMPVPASSEEDDEDEDEEYQTVVTEDDD